MENETLSTTTAPSTTTGDSLLGFAACLLSCICFGTMFAPLRGRDSRDGFFVQWLQCAVVFLFGFLINIVRGFPKFEPIAAAGGVLFATGNVASVPIVSGIGIGLGMLIWGSVQVTVGWGVARFGLPFDWLRESPVHHNAMNYAGMALTLICGVAFLFVRHEHQETKEEGVEKENGDPIPLEEKEEEREGPRDSATSTKKNLLLKLPYIGMAVFLGILHGLMMTPVDILKYKHPSTDKYRGERDLHNDLATVFDYVFSFFSTVFFFSSVYFILYTLWKRGKPYMPSSLFLPSLAYGVLWSTAMTLWFLSADKLQQTVAYPITTRLPAIIGALIDVFLFKSVKGRKNLAYLAVVIGLGVLGVVLIALSNQKL